MRIQAKITTSDWIWDKLGEDEFEFQRDLYWADEEDKTYYNRLGIVAIQQNKDCEILPFIDSNLLQSILNEFCVITPQYLVDGANDVHIRCLTLLPKERFRPITEEEYKERYIHT